MAETTAPEEQQVTDPNTADAPAETDVDSAEPTAPDTESEQKRAQEQEKKQSQEESGATKKLKAEGKGKAKEVEEGGESEEQEEGEEEEKKEEEGKEEKEPLGDPVKLGHKTFGSAMEMFDYFHNFLHAWGTDLNINKYEHLMLLELLKNGHDDPDKKIRRGIRAFQIRKHPKWQSRCFFLIREDGSEDDFSFRKCVDHIAPLPEEMRVKSGANRALGKHRGGASSKPGGRGRGGGRR